MGEVERYEVVEAEIVEAGSSSLQLSEAARAAVEGTRPDSTLRAYRADREEYMRWCQAEGHTPLPATPELLTVYVKHMTTAPRPRTGRPAAPSSIDRAIAAVSTMHEEVGMAKPVQEGARRVLKAYKAELAVKKDQAAKTKKASAAVPDILRKLLATLDRDTLKGKRDAALMLLGFATAARVSELVAMNIEELLRTEDGIDISVYRKKTHNHTDNMVLYGSRPATCPVRAVNAYLAALEQEGRTEGPLFVRVSRHGHVAPPMLRHGRAIGDPAGRMTEEAAAEVVEKAAASAGLEGQWTGHSLRRGFATAARRAGADMLRIGRTGGWADGSRALLGYMEDADRVTESPLVGIGL
ncbi:tyrosine-type recombinase/integrase [Streptomyces albicerus]|uniref:tyrosine-type recombinase/integrase n=1 Tax=Streptomyces albicerus TaxID=2569859 RepID=UPI00124BA212|nr:tyrosine-type recombinase/integrase [Streptomyces albicerus]